MALDLIDYADKADGANGATGQISSADINQIKTKANEALTFLNALAALFNLDNNGLPTSIKNSSLPSVDIFTDVFNTTDFVVSNGLIALANGQSLPVPDPLTNGVVDDVNNTFTATLPNGYLATDVERTYDGGNTWAAIVSLPINVGNVAFAIGQVGLRIKATSERQHSTTLFNATAFTTSGGGGDPDAGFTSVVPFNLGTNMVATGNSIEWDYVSPNDNTFWNQSTLKGAVGSEFEIRFTVDPTKNSGLIGLTAGQGGGYSPDRMQYLRSSDTHGGFQTITGNNTYVSSPNFDFTTPPRGRIRSDGTNLTMDYSIDGGNTWINIQTVAAFNTDQYIQGGFVYFNGITTNVIKNIIQKGMVAA